jgi:SAM-dependent methyltransferase
MIEKHLLATRTKRTPTNPKSSSTTTSLVVETPQRLKFVDLGSGAGESTIEAARRGYDSLGVEINPALLMLSKTSALLKFGPFNNFKRDRRKSSIDNTKKGGVGTCMFKSSNLLTLPLHEYDVIFMFGVKPLLGVIGPRLQEEMKPGGLLLLYRFQLHDEVMRGGGIDRISNIGEMYLYEKKREEASLRTGNLHT